MTHPPATRWADAARPGARVGHRIEVHRAIGSTNDRARELLGGPDGAGVAVVAEEQTAGRGRRGRTWLTPPGRGLALSVGVRPSIAARDAWQVGLAAGLAVRAACAADERIWLKWPNDLVDAGGRKLGGILVESTLEGERLSSIVIGIGINTDWPTEAMPPEIASSAVSLADLTGRPVGRAALLARLLEALEGELARIERGESPLDRYRQACSTIGAHVRVEAAGRPVEGHARDVNAHGALVVETSTGPVEVDSGEVLSVRTAVPA